MHEELLHPHARARNPSSCELHLKIWSHQSNQANSQVHNLYLETISNHARGASTNKNEQPASETSEKTLTSCCGWAVTLLEFCHERNTLTDSHLSDTTPRENGTREIQENFLTSYMERLGEHMAIYLSKSGAYQCRISQFIIPPKRYCS